MAYLLRDLDQNLCVHTLSTALIAGLRQTADACVTVVATFIIVGAWHGTTMNFIVFGLLHAAGILLTGLYGQILKNVLDRETRKKFEGHPAVHAIAVIVCFHYVAATILLFPNSVADLTEVLGQFLSNMQ